MSYRRWEIERESTKDAIQQMRKQHGGDRCLVLRGNHDEHQCHKKPGHSEKTQGAIRWDRWHECTCGVWW